MAMVGIIEREEHITTQFFKADGDVILLIGELGREVGASHFLKVCHGRKEGLPPRLDVARELAVHSALRELIRSGLVRSAHDCAEGGLAVALAECCFNPQERFGAAVDLRVPDDSGGRIDELLFGESQSRVVISVAKENLERALAALRETKVPHAELGTVTVGELTIRAGGEHLRWSTAELYNDWWNAIARAVA